ncbi:Uncharacterized protein APZ42_030215 [Daphnia magna]|uniref:Uncharacterized protein n=1 Tax=Daphnia magna TaxID=35525 RepID=A0A0P6CKD8_9CRUS|nr:Uncharacterized protein APZ42_030215 [Daphnia magna]
MTVTGAGKPVRAVDAGSSSEGGAIGGVAAGKSLAKSEKVGRVYSLPTFVKICKTTSLEIRRKITFRITWYNTITTPAPPGIHGAIGVTHQ